MHLPASKKILKWFYITKLKQINKSFPNSFLKYASLTNKFQMVLRVSHLVLEGFFCFMNNFLGLQLQPKMVYFFTPTCKWDTSTFQLPITAFLFCELLGLKQLWHVLASICKSKVTLKYNYLSSNIRTKYVLKSR